MPDKPYATRFDDVRCVVCAHPWEPFMEVVPDPSMEGGQRTVTYLGHPDTPCLIHHPRLKGRPDLQDEVYNRVEAIRKGEILYNRIDIGEDDLLIVRATEAICANHGIKMHEPSAETVELDGEDPDLQSADHWRRVAAEKEKIIETLTSESDHARSKIDRLVSECKDWQRESEEWEKERGRLEETIEGMDALLQKSAKDRVKAVQDEKILVTANRRQFISLAKACVHATGRNMDGKMIWRFGPPASRSHYLESKEEGMNIIAEMFIPHL